LAAIVIISVAGRVEDVDEEEEEQEEQEVEEEEEEEEEEAIEETASPWAGIKTLPERDDLLSLIGELQEAGKKQLTILLLGKSSVGKSSLVNSILNEQLARVVAFKLQADTEIVSPFVKQIEDSESGADGFRIKLIDTCGLEDPEAGDTVNYAALKKIANDIKDKPIDVVLYVDRLDLYRVEPLDQAVSRLGAKI
jgi:predicted GTPase